MYPAGKFTHAQGRTIAGEIAVTTPGLPATEDPLASQRLALVGQLVVAQFDIEAAIGELARSGASTGPLLTQLQNLTQLQRQVGTATPATLAMLRADVGAAVSQSQSVAQDARGTGAANTADSASVISLAATSRAQVSDIMRDMHQFDRELDFTSPEEEAAYRQREAERRAYIAQEQDKHTPEGDLNAAGGAVGQMADAKAHGADSPEFQKRWNELADSTQKLRAQLLREGKDVSQFDARLRDDLRTIMRDKGIPESQIDSLFAAHPDDPLQAAKAFVSETDVGRIASRRNAHAETAMPETTIVAEASPVPSVVVPNSALDAMAELTALGVIAVPHEADAPPSHGVAVQLRGPSQAANLPG